MTIAWSALILGEHLTLLVAAGAVVVLLCAVTAIRSRIRTS
jgi:drug/metabolite transporter (DMT)-like permease